MCPADDSHLTYEFHDHYVIEPSISFASYRNFSENKLHEKGSIVNQGFEYNSGTNSQWLTEKEFLELIKDI